MSKQIRLNFKLILSLACTMLLVQETFASAINALKYLDEIIFLAEHSSDFKSFDEILVAAKARKLIPDDVENIDDLIKLLDDPSASHVKEVGDLKAVLKNIKDNPHSWRLILKYRQQIERLIDNPTIFKASGQDMSARYVTERAKTTFQIPNDVPATAPKATTVTRSTQARRTTTTPAQAPHTVPKANAHPVVPQIETSKVFTDLSQSLAIWAKKLGNPSEIFKPETLRSVIDLGLSQGHDLKRMLATLTSPDELVRFLNRLYLKEKSKLLDDILSLPEGSMERINKSLELEVLDRNFYAITTHLDSLLPPSPSKVVRESLDRLTGLRRKLPNPDRSYVQYAHTGAQTDILARVHPLEDAAEEFLEHAARGPGEDLVGALRKRKIDVVYSPADDVYYVSELSAREAKKAADEITSMMATSQDTFLRESDDLLSGLSVDARLDYLVDAINIKHEFISNWIKIKSASLSQISDFYKSMHQALETLASNANAHSVSRIPMDEVEKLFAKNSELGRYLDDVFNRDSVASPWDLSDVEDLVGQTATSTTKQAGVSTLKVFEQRRVYRLISSSPITQYVFDTLTDANLTRVDLGFIHPDTVAVIKSADELVPGKFKTIEDYQRFRTHFGSQLTMAQLQSLRKKSWSLSAIKQSILEMTYIDNHVYTAQKTSNKVYDILTSGTAFSIIGTISGILIGSKIVAGFFSIKTSAWELFGWEVPEKEKMMTKDKSVREARADESSAALIINTEAQLVAGFAKSVQEAERSIIKFKTMKESTNSNEQLLTQLDAEIAMQEEQIQRDLQSIDFELLRIGRALVAYDDHYSTLSELLASNSFHVERKMTDYGSLGKKASSIAITYRMVPGGERTSVSLIYKRELDERYTTLKNQGLVEGKELRSDWVRVLMALPDNVTPDQISSAVFK